MPASRNAARGETDATSRKQRHFKKAVMRPDSLGSFAFTTRDKVRGALLISKGIGEEELQEWLGHESSRSHEPYRHLFDGHRDRLARALNDIYRDGRATVGALERTLSGFRTAQGSFHSTLIGEKHAVYQDSYSWGVVGLNH